MNCHGLVIKNNTIIRDGGIHTPRTESGGLDISYGVNVIVQGNYVTTLGELDYGNNDGECLLSQIGGDNRFYDVGMLTQVSEAQITDNSKAWVQNWKPETTVIAITSGAALGQWRTVLRHTATTVTLDRPWDSSARPAPGDQFAVTTWNLRDAVISGNTFFHNPKPLEIYNGGLNVTLKNNTLIDSAGIVINGWDWGGNHQERGSHSLVWNCEILGNRIQNPNGRRFSYVGIIGIQKDKIPHGNLTWHNTIQKNKVVAHPAGSTPEIDLVGVVGDGTYSKVTPDDRDPAVNADTIPEADNGKKGKPQR